MRSPPILSTAFQNKSSTAADTADGYTKIGDGGTARYYPPGLPFPRACTQPALAEDNGTIVVNLGNVPQRYSFGNLQRILRVSTVPCQGAIARGLDI